MRPEEEAKVQRLLALFTHIDLDFAIAWRGGEMRRHYHTRLADALIAATALIHHLRLATRNLQHFTPIEGHSYWIPGAWNVRLSYPADIPCSHPCQESKGAGQDPATERCGAG